MNLTSEQQNAARACGFTLLPANEAQVQRFSMQRRIFRVGSEPFLATRDGIYWETHGTLMQAISGCERTDADPPAGVPANLPDEIVEAAETAAPAASSDDHGEGRHEPQEPVSDAQEGPVASPHNNATRPARTRRRKRPPAGEKSVPSVMSAAKDGSEELVESIRMGSTERTIKDEHVSRRPHIRGAKSPRWMTAGKARRGRLK